MSVLRSLRPRSFAVSNLECHVLIWAAMSTKITFCSQSVKYGSTSPCSSSSNRSVMVPYRSHKFRTGRARRVVFLLEDGVQARCPFVDVEVEGLPVRRAGNELINVCGEIRVRFCGQARR